MKTITEYIKIISITTLQYEIKLLSIEFELCKQITKYLIYIQTFSMKYPIKTWLLKAIRYRGIINRIIHMSNLEYLVKQYPDYITEIMEEIHSYIKSSWWTLINTTTHIINIPKDKAKEEYVNFLRHNNTSNILNIYTDGSGIENHIETTVYSSTISVIAHDYLGKTDNANVYTTELMTIHLGVKMTDKSPELYDKCYIYIDNQSAI